LEHVHRGGFAIYSSLQSHTGQAVLAGLSLIRASRQTNWQP